MGPRKKIVIVVVSAVAAVLLMAAGFVMASMGVWNASDGGVLAAQNAGYTSSEMAPSSAPARDMAMTEEYAGMGADTGEMSAEAGTAGDSLIIRNSSMDVRVDDVAPAIEKVRTAVSSTGGEITSLSVSSGEDIAVPYATRPIAHGPASAYITIRVPAQDLLTLEDKVAGVGTVLSQSSSTDDVTEQAIDLEARLDNLRAQESQLRSFLERTVKVSELLEVERELSRVRGDIESMDAQLTYLKRQAAQATLTISLTEPGPIAQTAGISWDLREALARGVRIAAAMVNAAVTVVVPLGLLLIVVAIVVLPVRAIRKHATKADADTDAADGDAPGGP
jgi:hypothetical protein